MDQDTSRHGLCLQPPYVQRGLGAGKEDLISCLPGLPGADGHGLAGKGEDAPDCHGGLPAKALHCGEGITEPQLKVATEASRAQ